jgi:transposase
MSKKRIFTEEETKFIIQKYKNGSTLGEIRKILGCKSIKITNCLSENNIELRNRYWFQKSGLMKFETKLDPAKHLELSKEYENGAKIKDLVEKYGISHQTILTTIRKAGGKIKKKGEGCRKILSEQQKNQIIDLHNAGNTPSEISIETKIHEQRIKKFLIQSNIETNKKIKIRKLTLPNQIDLERFLFLYNQNLSLTKISIELEVSYPRIKKIIASLNLPKFSVPAPQGAGVGWKGWYKGIYFRSLREVSYLLYLDKNNIPWTPAEKKKYTIPYINWDGAERTYRPDFLINNDTLIEIKPKRLQKSPNVMAKTKAALIWAAENGLKYEIIDFPINQSEILAQIDINIKFDRDYKEKFLKYVKIKN